VILQLVEILVLLIVGFIIAVILSWIYDVKPEGGIVKTEVALRDPLPSSLSGMIAPRERRWISSTVT
jgi:hypothetical protein